MDAETIENINLTSLYLLKLNTFFILWHSAAWSGGSRCRVWFSNGGNHRKN